MSLTMFSKVKPHCSQLQIGEQELGPYCASTAVRNLFKGARYRTKKQKNLAKRRRGMSITWHTAAKTWPRRFTAKLTDFLSHPFHRNKFHFCVNITLLLYIYIYIIYIYITVYDHMFRPSMLAHLQAINTHKKQTHRHWTAETKNMRLCATFTVSLVPL
jgi:hypothetical protein